MNSMKLIQQVSQASDIIHASSVARAIGKDGSFAKAWTRAKKDQLVAFRVGQTSLTTIAEANRFLLSRGFIKEELPAKAFNYESKRDLPHNER